MTAISRFQNELKSGEAALIISSVNRRYLTSFLSSDGFLLVTSEFAELYLDSRYFEMAEKAKQRREIPENVELKKTGVYARASELFAGKSDSVLLYENKRLYCSELEALEKRLPGVKLAPLGDRLEALRAVKTKNELEKMQEAQNIAEKAFEHILNFINKNRTEKEIALELEFFMRRNGAENVSFDTICVSGKKSSMPHGRPDDILLTDNSFLTMDFGAVYDGYCSDMTRTVCVGKANDEMKEVYNTVLKAQLSAISAVKAGVAGKTVDNAARSIITDAGYGSFFGHSTGHGVGLEVHERPGFAPSSEACVVSGNVLSVEPGIYLPDKFGVRIEDVVCVTEDGHVNLTSAPKELIEL